MVSWLCEDRFPGISGLAPGRTGQPPDHARWNGPVTVIGMDVSAEQVRAAKDAYLQARRLRLEQAGVMSADDGILNEWTDNAELDLRTRREMQARAAWLALAPEEPTEWWPGGYRIREVDLMHPQGRIHHRGGVEGLGVWRTAAEAEDYLQSASAFSGEWAARGLVEWCAIRDEEPNRHNRLEARLVVLDADFWAVRQA
jgi:hypothetical protein